MNMRTMAEPLREIPHHVVLSDLPTDEVLARYSGILERQQKHMKRS